MKREQQRLVDGHKREVDKLNSQLENFIEAEKELAD
jgi:hypothetical protein